MIIGIGMPTKRIDESLEKELENIKKSIRDSFGIPITYVDAGKLLAWKSRTNKVKLDSEILKRVLGDNK